MAFRYLLELIILAILLGFSVEVDQDISSDGRGQLQTLCKTIINATTVAPDNLNTTSGNGSSCEDDCRQKYTPKDGTVNSLYNALHGWVLIISCNHGYELKGRASIICYEDIETKEFPVCEDQDELVQILRIMLLVLLFVFLLILVRELGRSLTRFRQRRMTLSKAEKESNMEDAVLLNFGNNRENNEVEYTKPLLYNSQVKVPPFIQPYTCVVTPLRDGSDNHDDDDNDAEQHDMEYMQSDDDLPYLPCDRRRSIEVVTLLHAADDYTNDDERDNDRHVCASALSDQDRSGNDRDETGQELSERDTDDTSNISRLNWNELFLRLANRCYTANWKLFAINLLGAHSQNDENVDTTIGQIENNSKTRPGGENIEVILYNILWHWKSISKRGSLNEIENALKHSHHEDVINFMKNNIDKFYKPDELIEQNTNLKIQELSDNLKSARLVHETCCSKFYKPDELIEQNTNLKIQELSDIPELEYRVTPRRHTIALHPCLDDYGSNNESGPFIQEPDQDVSYNQEAVPVVPYHRTSAEIFPYTRTPAPSVPYAGTNYHIIPAPENIVTLNHRFADTDRFRFRRGKRFNVTKRKYGNQSFQKPRNQLQPKPRTRHPARSTSKVQFSKKKTTNQCSTVHALSDIEKLCIDLLLSNLDSDTQKILNAMEYKIIMKYIVFKSKNAISPIKMDALSGIRFDDYNNCQHVLMPQNGTIHIMNSGGLTMPIKDDLWKLIETYLHRARAEVVSRVPNIDEHYLFLTYEGKQVTDNYIHMGDTATTEDESNLGHGRRSIAVGTEDIQESTSKAEDKKVVVCDCKRRLPITRNTTHAKRPNKVRLDTANDQQHKRRFFCGKQAVAVENIFRKEIRQGTVKEITVLTKFHDCAELREVFDLQPNDVSKILVKKITDRVRCFIRNKKN